MDPAFELKMLATLHPSIRTKCQTHISIAEGEGLAVRLYLDGGGRTDAMQIALYGKGRDIDEQGNWIVVDRKHVVTDSLPEEAPHCHAGAYDLWLMYKGRRATMDPQDGWTHEEITEQLVLWGKLVKIGTDLGLQPGAHWPKLKDWPHFELPHNGWRALPRVSESGDAQ